MTDPTPTSSAPAPEHLNHDRATRGLETAPPDELASVSPEAIQAYQNARPITGFAEALLMPRLVELLEMQIDNKAERIKVLFDTAQIVKVMEREARGSGERYQYQLIAILEDQEKPKAPFRDALVKEADQLPQTIVSTTIKTAILVVVALILLACGLPSIL